MIVGSKVFIKPTEKAPQDLRDKVAALGPLVGLVHDSITPLNQWFVVLPWGLTIAGYSYPVDDGRHNIVLGKEDLELVEEHPSPLRFEVSIEQQMDADYHLGMHLRECKPYWQYRAGPAEVMAMGPRSFLFDQTSVAYGTNVRCKFCGWEKDVTDYSGW